MGTQLDIAACDGMPAAGMVSEPITYTPEQQVATVTTPAAAGTQTASYAYDADGDLIAQDDPASDTIYLLGGAEQVTYTARPPPKTIAQRFYTAPDGTTAIRTFTSGTTGTTAPVDIPGR